MLRDEILEGVSSAGKARGFEEETIERVTAAIATEAISVAKGREALALSRDGDHIVHYNLFKAIAAAAGALGATLSISLPLAWPPVLAAIGALGALSGLREPLPEASAAIVTLLYAEQGRSLNRQTLRSRFEESYDGPTEELSRDFENGLKALDRIKSIVEDRGIVRLKELVILRF